MDDQYRKEFLMMKIVSIAMGLVSLAMVGATELWRGYRYPPWALVGEAGAGTAAVLRSVFYVLSALLLFLALSLKRTIRRDLPGSLRALIRALAVSAHRRRSGSAFGALAFIASLAEAVSVFGLVLFVLDGGSRAGYLPFFLAAILAQVYLFPTEQEGPVLAEIDREALRQTA